MKLYEIFFSPTGSTQRISGILAEALCDSPSAIDITVSPKERAFNADDVCLIAMPSFGGRVPVTAAKRIARLEGNGARAILVCVYGNRAFDDTLIEMKDLAIAAGFRPIAAVAALAEHSIVRQFAAGRPDADDEQELRTFAAKIASKLADPDAEIVSVPGNTPYRPGGRGSIRPVTNRKCIKCGLCAAHCSSKAIDPKKPNETIDEKCISCMRCIAVCPRKARSVDAAVLDSIAEKIGPACAGRKENELFL